jgi:predicted PurR-regulated permease PerM
MNLKVEYRTGWIAGALVLLLSFWILRSFVVPLAWASIVALASWPVYRRFANRLAKRFASTWAPLLFTALVSLSVLGPIVFAFGALAAQARTWAPQLVAAEKQGLAPPGWLEDVPAIGGWLVDQWDATLGTPGGIALCMSGQFRPGLAHSDAGARELGARRLLPKPFGRTDLLDAVRAAIDQPQ